MIPRKIHFVWIGGEMPGFARECVAEWRRLNPDSEVLLHGDEALHPDYRAAFDAAPCLESKADLIRYSVMEAQGGWYFDCDFWPFRPVADIERAYGLDGSKLFLAEQHGQKNARLTVSNGVLFGEPGHPVWTGIRRAVRMMKPPCHRVQFGPELMRGFAGRRDVIVGAWPFWFPSGRESAAADCAEIRFGDSDWARRMCPETGGQAPFAMHLWACGGEVDIETRKLIACVVANEKSPALREFALPGAGRWREGHALAAAKAGLEAAGYEVAVVDSMDEVNRKRRGKPALAVVWNGVRNGEEAAAAGELRRLGAEVLYCEHGWWDRFAHVQLAADGWGSWASWAREWPEPPEGAAERLRGFLGGDPAPVRARDTGPILVIGQVGRDTQLRDSELAGPAPLEKHVSRALPKGVQAVFRPHPNAKGNDAMRRGIGRAMMPRTTGALAEDLESCRFAVAINSTAISEAIAAGAPCLEFGPSLALNAGASRQATLSTLRADIEAMLAGWEPDPQDARRYLEWLACRQHSIADMRKPEFWRERRWEI